MSVGLEVNDDTVRQLIVYLRKWHAAEGATGQNDGSNDSDDIHDELEMHKGHVDKADLEGIYNNLDVSEKADISALVLIGMEEERTLKEARQRIAREEVLGLDDLLEMPLSPEYLATALGQVSGENGNVTRLRPRDDVKSAQ